MGPSGRFTHGLLGHVIYRLCAKGRAPRTNETLPDFVRDIGSPGIQERFRWLTGSQRTPEIWGVT